MYYIFTTKPSVLSELKPTYFPEIALLRKKGQVNSSRLVRTGRYLPSNLDKTQAVVCSAISVSLRQMFSVEL